MKWPIMVTLEPEPEYAEAMEDLILVWKPAWPDNAEPRVVPWEELGFEEMMEWMLENATFPGDLDPVIKQLRARRDQIKRDEKRDERRESYL